MVHTPDADAPPTSAGTDPPARKARLAAAEERWVQTILDDPALQQRLRESVLATQEVVAHVSRALQDIIEPLTANLNDSLAPLLESLRSTFRLLLPPNLRPIWEQVSPAHVRDFVREEGIPLYLVPRASIGLELLTAETHAARRAVLGRRFDALLDDCDAVLDTCDDPRWSDQVFFIRDAVGAARAGHTPSAQALAASVLDTLFSRYAPDERDRRNLRSRDKDGNPPKEIVEEALVLAYVLLPIWNAYMRYHPDKGDPVPRDFARHASAHGVGRRQYSKRNCMQACMLATSLLGYLQGQDPRSPRAAPVAESPSGRSGSSRAMPSRG